MHIGSGLRLCSLRRHFHFSLAALWYHSIYAVPSVENSANKAHPCDQRTDSSIGATTPAFTFSHPMSSRWLSGSSRLLHRALHHTICWGWSVARCHFFTQTTYYFVLNTSRTKNVIHDCQRHLTHLAFHGHGSGAEDKRQTPPPLKKQKTARRSSGFVGGMEGKATGELSEWQMAK